VTVSAGCSPTSQNPPGEHHSSCQGACARRQSSTRPSRRTIPFAQGQGLRQWLVPQLVQMTGGPDGSSAPHAEQ
jgi:hypothetical protein